MTTTKDITRIYNVSRDKVKQVKTQQLFIVDLPAGKILVSYTTVVGKFINSSWYLTTERYSVPTSKQLNSFKRNTAYTVIYVDDINIVPRETKDKQA